MTTVDNGVLVLSGVIMDNGFVGGAVVTKGGLSFGTLINGAWEYSERLVLTLNRLVLDPSCCFMSCFWDLVVTTLTSSSIRSSCRGRTWSVEYYVRYIIVCVLLV